MNAQATIDTDVKLDVVRMIAQEVLGTWTVVRTQPAAMGVRIRCDLTQEQAKVLREYLEEFGRTFFRWDG